MRFRFLKTNYLTFYLRSVIIFTALLLQSLQAQTNFGKLEGYIFDKNGNPLDDVNVMIENLNIADVSDLNGYFSLEKITPGIYSLKIEHIRYKSRTIENIRIFPNQTTKIDTVVLGENVFDAKEIVVTAARTAQNIDKIPQQINLVSAEQIKKRQAKTSAEALREETGISIQKTNHGGGSAIIRGLSSNQILILVDGIRLNNSTYRLGNHQYLTTVDNQIADQIEVVRGPASVLYGSDALGGTINILTKKPEFTQELSFNYEIFGRYASADEERTTRTESTMSYDNFVLLTGFSFKEYGDLKRGKNSDYTELEKSTDGLKQTPSGFKAYDLDVKMIYGLDQNQSITLAYQFSRQKEVPRYDKYEINNYHQWIYEPQRRNLIYLSYENKSAFNYFSSLKASLSSHQQEEGRLIQKTDSSQIEKENDKVKTIGFTFELDKEYKTHRLTLGADIYLDKVFSEAFSKDFGSVEFAKASRGRYPDGATYNSFGLFLQDEIKINPKWSLIPGFRYNYFHTMFSLLPENNQKIDEEKINKKFSSLTGSMSAVYRINDNLRLSANLAQAFRAPNLSDFSKFGESKGNIFEIPNKNIEPEKMMSIDFGCAINYSNLKAHAAVYYSKIWDLLASANTTHPTFLDSNYIVKSKQNIGTATIHGIEAALEYNFFSDLFLYGNFTSTFGKNLSLNEPVSKIPPSNGRVGIEYKKDDYYFSVFSRFASKQNRLSSDDKDDPRIPPGGTPGWRTFNFRAGVELNDYSQINFAIENILDYNYREHGSGINGPGRNFIVSLDLKN